MYRAYERYLYERSADTPAVPKIVPLAGDQLDPRVVVHRLRRDWPGARNVLGVGRATSRHDRMNLAEGRAARPAI